jgi:hypothetical protein
MEGRKKKIKERKENKRVGLGYSSVTKHMLSIHKALGLYWRFQPGQLGQKIQ